MYLNYLLQRRGGIKTRQTKQEPGVAKVFAKSIRRDSLGE